MNLNEQLAQTNAELQEVEAQIEKLSVRKQELLATKENLEREQQATVAVVGDVLGQLQEKGMTTEQIMEALTKMMQTDSDATYGRNGYDY